MPMIQRVQERALEGAVRGEHSFQDSETSGGRGWGSGSRNREQAALTVLIELPICWLELSAGGAQINS